MVENPDPLIQARIARFYDFFENKTVKTPFKPGRGGYPAKTVHHAPLFPIELWNINSHHIEGLPRTNNFSEGWHSAFSAVLTSHPSVYKLVAELRKEQKRTENILAKIETGVKFKHDSTKEDRVNEIMLDYMTRF